MYILCYYSVKVHRILVMTFVRGDQAQVHDGSGSKNYYEHGIPGDRGVQNVG